MSVVEIHTRLANTTSYFLAALTIWAFYLWWRNQSLSGGWLGAFVIYEGIVIVEGLLGGYLYWLGLGSALPRPWLHILYAFNAIVVLPAAYLYFGSIDNERARSLAMALAGAFAWLMLQRNFVTGLPVASFVFFCTLVPKGGLACPLLFFPLGNDAAPSIEKR